ncbi:hypothetical protein RND81_12G238000 [Saponaria officinalis]|uniref:Trichome birefringence-like N-terminal domain-containing protein n=1 Tax=Saponaria officinalis TaxID=3572 RepID=A0AAW1HEN9_SAPOF
MRLHTKYLIYILLFLLTFSTTTTTTHISNNTNTRISRTINNATIIKNKVYKCDYFKGRWIADFSFPLYNPEKCAFIQKEFSCSKNGRRDQLYLHYGWKPLSCDLHRFNARDFLERFRGKNIMFVGDSLSLNQWQSLTCMLHAAVPTASYTLSRQDGLSTFSFPEYRLKIMLDRSVYLVDVIRHRIGRILKLDSISGGRLWKSMDVLIFNTWHWWNRRGPTQPWDYIRYRNITYKDMNRMVAFEIALNTWGKWVDTTIDPKKTKVFFQGISPSHYNGSDWEQPDAINCLRQTQPVIGSTYPGGIPEAVTVLKRALSKIKKPVTLLDITLLSLLRKDAHPSIYGLFSMDCSHWCLPGVPDIWNQILYNFFL